MSHTVCGQDVRWNYSERGPQIHILFIGNRPILRTVPPSSVSLVVLTLFCGSNFGGIIFINFISVSGKCEWQHQFIIRIQDQPLWIFGEKQQDLKITN